MTVSEVLKAYERETIEWRKSDRVQPRPEWWEALERIVECVAERKNIQPHQHLAANNLITAYLKFLALRIADQLPSQEVYRAIDELRQAEPMEMRKTEPVVELAKLEGITHHQIAAMHGLSASDVSQIIAGQKKYPEGHVTPEERRRIESIRQNAREYFAAAEAWKARPVASVTSEPVDNWVPPPESIEELLSLPNMTVNQVAKMHRKSVEEIQAIRDGRQFIPIDPNAIADEEPDIDREIYACADGGASEKEISEMLGLPMKQVKEVLKKRMKVEA
jgi:hypothetical protein